SSINTGNELYRAVLSKKSANLLQQQKYNFCPPSKSGVNFSTFFPSRALSLVNIGRDKSEDSDSYSSSSLLVPEMRDRKTKSFDNNLKRLGQRISVLETVDIVGHASEDRSLDDKWHNCHRNRSCDERYKPKRSTVERLRKESLASSVASSQDLDSSVRSEVEDVTSQRTSIQSFGSSSTTTQEKSNFGDDGSSTHNSCTGSQSDTETQVSSVYSSDDLTAEILVSIIYDYKSAVLNVNVMECKNLYSENNFWASVIVLFTSFYLCGWFCRPSLARKVAAGCGNSRSILVDDYYDFCCAIFIDGFTLDFRLAVFWEILGEKLGRLLSQLKGELRTNLASFAGRKSRANAAWPSYLVPMLDGCATVSSVEEQDMRDKKADEVEVNETDLSTTRDDTQQQQMTLDARVANIELKMGQLTGDINFTKNAFTEANYSLNSVVEKLKITARNVRMDVDTVQSDVYTLESRVMAAMQQAVAEAVSKVTALEKRVHVGLENLDAAISNAVDQQQHQKKVLHESVEGHQTASADRLNNNVVIIASL
uniref:Uncharacterized protein n=1 Tax=Romanomermis culicivorax TaxID=13658 RepID=A0A915I4B2_ROMCU